LQKEIVVAIVRVVAAAAGHAAESQWMAAGFIGIGAFILMAVETGLLLRQRIKNPVTLCVHLVAGRTGKVFTLVCAAEPPQAPPGCMTAQANPVLFRDRRITAVTESNRRITVFTLALGAGVFLAGSMAGFALEI